MQYALPCSPAVLCEDRFDLLGSNEFQVPFWRVFEAALAQKLSSYSDLIDLLETIYMTLHGHNNSDYVFLREFLQEDWQTAESSFFKDTWPALAKSALDMPNLFPSMSISALSNKNPTVSLSRQQIACLVVHQFLCSFPVQPWSTDSFIDFHIWYSSGSRHPKATKSYLIALFTYFKRIGHDEISSSTVNDWNNPLLCDWPIIFILREAEPDFDARDEKLAAASRFLPLEVRQEPIHSTKPSLLGVPDGACVVFANKNVGFGQTGTQEEIHVGTSPECCPIVLIAPPLRNNQVIIVRGAEAMVRVNGYGRDAEIDKAGSRHDMGGFNNSWEPSMWRTRTMLFMDALELDIADQSQGLPDLFPGHVARELTKAFAAFNSYNNNANTQPYTKVVTGLWGCGAFGGNKEVKTLIQWCAASLAGVPLCFVCSGHDNTDFALSLKAFTRKMQAEAWTVKEALHILYTTKPTDAVTKNMFAHVIECLEQTNHETLIK